jgi:catechol 2,3-dioxygenase-like lactoylglutathione lyase family enzyme
VLQLAHQKPLLGPVIAEIWQQGTIHPTRKASDAMRGSIRGLGEVALRVTDLDRMQAFYQDVIGLELLRRFERAAFFRLAEGFGGHTQVLALFDRTTDPSFAGLNSATTTVDHLAFEIELADYEPERQRLTECGLAVTTAEHGWVHWRSLYVDDPDGNTVELVCYDPSVVEKS